MFFQEKKALAWAGCRKGNSTFYIDCGSAQTEVVETRPSGASAERHAFLQYAISHFRETHSRKVLIPGLPCRAKLVLSVKLVQNSSVLFSRRVLHFRRKRDSASIKFMTWRKSKSVLEWTWKEITDKVKYSPFPITSSLLKLESDYLNRLAVDGFKAIMRYMGDLPLGVHQRDVECVYILLVMCHHHPALRDETVCQLIKQTTNNKSLNPESRLRGWRLLSFLLSFFRCSDSLMPYLQKYVDSAAHDSRRTEQDAARVCLLNLRQTVRYGGRRNVPTEREVKAIAEDQSMKQQKYYLPGGVQVLLSTSSSTVVGDVIRSICREMGINEEDETAEFSLYCIVEGDESTFPLEKDEYVLDLTAELERNANVFYLVFCRSLWCRDLRLHSELYTELVFHQTLPDYLEGYLLTSSHLPFSGIEEEMSRIAHLLHRASGLETVPTEFDLIQLVPKPALKKRRPKFDPEVWNQVTALTAIESKAQCLEFLQKWTLFGSSFFAAKILEAITEEETLLAVNKLGIHVLHRDTHEILWRFSFSATRFKPSSSTVEEIEMELGDIHFKKTVRLRVDHAHEMERLVRQYDAFLHDASGPAITLKV